MSIIKIILLVYLGISIITWVIFEAKSHLIRTIWHDLVSDIEIKQGWGRLFSIIIVILVETFAIIISLIASPIIIWGREKKEESRVSSKSTKLEQWQPSMTEINVFIQVYSKRYTIQTAVLPLEMSQVIYVEPEYNPALNNYITEHLQEIETYYKRVNCEFIYWPSLLDNSLFMEIMQYNYPIIRQIKTVHRDEISTAITKLLFKNSDKGLPDTPTLIARSRKAGYETDKMLIGFRFDKFSPKALQYHFKLHAYISRYPSPSDQFYQLEKKQRGLPYDADEAFASDAIQIADDIKEKINLLRRKGYYDLVLEALIGAVESSLSSIHITQDYKIILPESLVSNKNGRVKKLIK